MPTRQPWPITCINLARIALSDKAGRSAGDFWLGFQGSDKEYPIHVSHRHPGRENVSCNRGSNPEPGVHKEQRYNRKRKCKESNLLAHAAA